MSETGTMRVKSGLAEMLKGGVIMDVTTADQARIAEDAGACAVMALERVPADIRRDGGVARMADPAKIREIQDTVTIPVMAKARIGHFAEAQVLQALEVDYIDESEVLTPADEANHINKWRYTVPFVCGATNLGEALRLRTVASRRPGRPNITRYWASLRPCATRFSPPRTSRRRGTDHHPAVFRCSRASESSTQTSRSRTSMRPDSRSSFSTFVSVSRLVPIISASCMCVNRSSMRIPCGVTRP